MNRRRVSALSAFVALLLLVTGFVVSPAQASATNIVSIPNNLAACNGVAQDVGLTKHEGGFRGGVYNTFGKSYPVILVHGLDGKNSGAWGDLDQSTDLAARINEISNATVAVEFQYDSSNDYAWGGWPPHAIGFSSHLQPLANAIDCIAQISAQSNGPGKVIVVGYSEGSALAHGAATKKSSDGQRSVGDEIGQAVTVADARISYPTKAPLFGVIPSGIFDAPDFPSNITVHAISGNLINVVKTSDGSYTHEQMTHGDGLVHVSDATKQSTNNAGGGTHITSCFRVYPRYAEVLHTPVYLGTPNSPTCAHGNLLRNSEETQWDIVDAITDFVNAHCNNSNPGDNPVSPTPTAAPTTASPTPTDTPGTPGTPQVPGGNPTDAPTINPTSVPSPPPISGCHA